MNDFNSNSSYQKLRSLEINTYKKVLQVFKAQGDISGNKQKILDDLKSELCISDDKHHTIDSKLNSDTLIKKISVDCQHILKDRSTNKDKYFNGMNGVDMDMDIDEEPDRLNKKYVSETSKRILKRYLEGGQSEDEKDSKKKKNTFVPQPQLPIYSYTPLNETIEEQRYHVEIEETVRPLVDDTPVSNYSFEKPKLEPYKLPDTITKKEDEIDFTKIKNAEELEKIAENINEQIEELEKLSGIETRPHARDVILEELKRKRERIAALLEHIEVILGE